jgi:hypothetical protein
MDGIVGSLRLGWDALLLKEDAYEEMRADTNPVVKGLILIVVVGVIVALFGLVGSILEWASTPDLAEIRDTVFYYLTQMPWWKMAAQDPNFIENFQGIWDFNWGLATNLAPTPGSAALNIVFLPVALIVRWLIYGLLAYLFARWLGGTGTFSETLGVLALAVAPQALAALNLIPFVEIGNLVSIWAILCAYVGLKTAHKLRWNRAMYATVLPFLLVIAVAVLAGCLGSAIFAILVKGG